MVPMLGSSIFPLHPEDLEWGTKSLQACLGVAPQPSPLPWRSTGISSMQRRGIEADRLSQLISSLLSPNTRRETGDSGNGVGPSLPPHCVHLRCLPRSSLT